MTVQKTEHKDRSTVTENEPRAVIVLGMHRSGTSAWTRLLNLAGVDLGTDFLGNNENNPKGVWENAKVTQLNDQILRRLGYRWDSVELIPEWAWGDSAIQPLRAALSEALRQEYHGKSLWGLKDPRLCRMLPLWRQIFGDMGVSPSYLLVLRHPLEVALSLYTRDRMPPEKSVVLWLWHMLEAEAGTRGKPRSFVNYEGLFQDWLDRLEHVSSSLELDLSPNAGKLQRAVEDFVDAGLRHNHQDAIDESWISLCDPEVLAWAEQTYQILSRGDSLLDTGALDRIHQQLQARQHYHRADFVNKAREIHRFCGGSLAEIARRMSHNAAPEYIKQLDCCKADFYCGIAEILLRSITLNDEQGTATEGPYGSLQEGLDFIQEVVAERPDFEPAHQLLSDFRNALESARYQAWIQQNALQEIDGEMFAERMMLQWRLRPQFHLLVFLLPGELPLLADTLDSLGAQMYSRWRLTVIADIPAPDPLFEQMEQLHWHQIDQDETLYSALNQLAEEGDWIGLIDAGALLEPQCLIQCGDYINLQPDWKLVYTDEDRIDGQGKCSQPQFKPAINLDLLRSMPYTGHFCLIHRDALKTIGGFEAMPGGENYDLVLKAVDAFGENAIGHIATVLFHQPAESARPFDPDVTWLALSRHLQRNQVAARVQEGYVPGTLRVVYAHQSAPLVSIVVGVKDRLEFIQPCLESLLVKTDYTAYEILIVDNESSDPDLRAFYAHLQEAHPDRVRVLSQGGAGGFSMLYNLGARASRGEFLLFLNDDVEIVQSAWLERLLNHGQRPEIGMVGPRLVYPETNRLFQAGTLLGLEGTAASPYRNNLDIRQPGYMARAQADQNFSALHGACLLVKRSIFEELDGFDESLHLQSCAVLDLCLRAGQSGIKLNWTPYATLVCHGQEQSWERGSNRQDLATRRHQENDYVMTTWLSRLAHDPAYNPNLSLSGGEYRIEGEIPTWDVNFHSRPRVLGFPLAGGSGDYRVILPFNALSQAGLAQCRYVRLPKRKGRVLSPVELERLRPDSLVMHMAIQDIQLDALAHYRQFNQNVLRVFALDDHIIQIPEKSSAYKTLMGQFRDARSRLRKALSHCDRLIVSTQPLAELCADMIDDIRVIPNCLERERWSGLASLRRQGDKPRVGWAGAQQHQGDLELIIETVKATRHQVDWIFFGMCPDATKPYAKEIHDFVSIKHYPEKLASLNLDLAVAPLEDHPFNIAKSNLRLLEYGILGWPVVCTDIYPYQNAPVLRVPNSTDAWVEAIRASVEDLDACAQRGDELRSWVQSHYLIEDHLEAWLDALTP